MKSTIELLQEVHGVIKAGWTQRAYARNKHGTSIYYHEIVEGYGKLGTCFCLLGAATKVSIENGLKCVDFNLITSLSKVTNYSITEWNDKSDRTKNEVLKAINAAIKLEKYKS